jgi:TPR repeat protein
MGHPEAQTAYGYLYFEGLVVPQDYSEAAIWIRKAADQGHPEAQALLGLMYDGAGMLGVPYDRARAIELYLEAAEKGVGVAQFELSRKYLIGAGVPKDETIAFEWLSRAAAQGFAEAQYEIGQYYFHGFFNTPKSEAFGCLWSCAAAQQGHEDAQQNAPIFCGLLFNSVFGGTMDKIDEWMAGRPQPARPRLEKPSIPPARQ